MVRQTGSESIPDESGINPCLKYAPAFPFFAHHAQITYKSTELASLAARQGKGEAVSQPPEEILALRCGRPPPPLSPPPPQCENRHHGNVMNRLWHRAVGFGERCDGHIIYLGHIMFHETSQRTVFVWLLGG